MAFFKLGSIILLAFGCMYVTGEETENPTIEDCPASSSLDAPSSVLKYTCSGDPVYTVGTDATAAAMGTQVAYTSGEFTVTPLGQSLELSATPDCGVDLTESVTCDGLIIQMGSKAAGMDGSKIEVGGVGADGLVTWECEDTTPSSVISMNYYFPISFAADAEIGAPTVAFLTQSVSSSPTATDDTFDPMIFQKFSGVDADTSIYLLKESDTAYHTLFVSTSTTVMFKADQYNTIFGSDEVTANAVTAASVCDKAVQLCYGDMCEEEDEDGSAPVSLGIVMTFIPFIVTFFN